MTNSITNLNQSKYLDNSSNSTSQKNIYTNVTQCPDERIQDCFFSFLTTSDVATMSNVSTPSAKFVAMRVDAACKETELLMNCDIEEFKKLFIGLLTASQCFTNEELDAAMDKLCTTALEDTETAFFERFNIFVEALNDAEPNKPAPVPVQKFCSRLAKSLVTEARAWAGYRILEKFLPFGQTKTQNLIERVIATYLEQRAYCRLSHSSTNTSQTHSSTNTAQQYINVSPVDPREWFGGDSSPLALWKSENTPNEGSNTTTSQVVPETFFQRIFNGISGMFLGRDVSQNNAQNINRRNVMMPQLLRQAIFNYLVDIQNEDQFTPVLLTFWSKCESNPPSDFLDPLLQQLKAQGGFVIGGEYGDSRYHEIPQALINEAGQLKQKEEQFVQEMNRTLIEDIPRRYSLESNIPNAILKIIRSYFSPHAPKWNDGCNTETQNNFMQ